MVVIGPPGREVDLRPGGEFVGGEAGPGVSVLPGSPSPKGAIRLGPVRFIGGGGTSGGGGARGPSVPSGPSAPTGPSAADLKAESDRINQARAVLVNQARNTFRKDIRTASNQNERNIALNRLNQQIARADITAQGQREAAGISRVTQTPSRVGTGVQILSGGRETAVARALRGQEREGAIISPTIQDSKSAAIQKLEALGISRDKPGGRVIIGTVGGIERGIEKIKETGRELFSRRIPILDTSLSSITGKTVDTEIVIIDGEEVLVKKGSIQIEPSDEITPGTTGGPGVQQLFFGEPRDTIGPAPTTLERIQQFPGFLFREAKGKFGQLFIPEEGPSIKFRDISAREVAAVTASGLLLKAPKIAGQLPITIAEQLGFEGITTVVPETEIPVRRTVSQIPTADITGLTIGQDSLIGPREEIRVERRISTLPDITGLTIQQQEVTITPEQLRTVGGFVGQGIALTIAPTGVLLGGGAAIATAPAGVVTREERIEGAVIFGVGALMTASRLRSVRRITKARKTGDYAKLSNRELEQLFLTKPEVKIADLRTKKITEIRRRIARQKIGIRADQLDDLSTLEISTRPGGKTITSRFEPTEALTGKVKEIRKVGRKTKTFLGRAEISNTGEYTEVVNLGKNLRRITVIDDAGVGTVRIVRNGETIIEKQITSNFARGLKNIKPELKIERIKIDQKTSPTKTILESKIKTKGGTAESIQVIDDAGNIIISDVKEDLITKKIKLDAKVKAKLRKDPITGAFQIDEEASGFLDIIQTGPRKSAIQIKKGPESILVKKRVSQEIVFGQDSPIDVIIRKSIKDTSILKKAISPKVRREIQEGFERRVVSGFARPDPTDLAKTKAAQDKLIKLIKEDFAIESGSRKRLIKELEIKVAKLKPKEVRVVTEAPRPLIVGGEGGQAAASQFAGPSGLADEVTTFISEQVPRQVVVPPTSQFLTTPTPVVDTTIPLIFDAQLSRGGVQLGGLAATAIGTTVRAIDIQQPQLEITQKQIPQQVITLETQQAKVSQQQPVLQLQPSIQLQPQEILQKTQQLTKQQQKIVQKQQQQQQQLQLQQRQQIIQQRAQFRERLTPSPRLIPLPILGIPSPTTAPSAVQTVEAIFKIFTRKGGKDIKVAEESNLGDASQLLASKLRTSLRASGFIERNGQKIPASELNLIDGEFRQSKTDPWRIVEKKNRRLTTKQETEELQMFRGSPLLGGGQSTNLFGNPNSNRRRRRRSNAFNFFQ